MSIVTAEKTYTDAHESYCREDIDRVLGRLALEQLRSNDSLTDVFKLIEAGGDMAKIKGYIDKNYQTDMSERSDGRNEQGEKQTLEKPFYKTVDYHVEGDDLVADQVPSHHQMIKNGLRAAQNDFKQDPRLFYAVQRAEIQMRHLPMLLDWYRSGDPNCARISSLCPPDWEVSGETAKLANFKPDRMMASIWWFERSEQGVRMHVFSQDNLTLDGLQEIDRRLEIDNTVTGDTCREMDKLVSTPFSDAAAGVEAQRQVHDASLDRENGGQHHFGIKISNYDKRSANQMVEDKPEAEELWRNSVQAMAYSLMDGMVSSDLAKIVLDLRKGFTGNNVMPIELGLREGRSINEVQARAFMDYLRERALPQYIFGDYQQIATDQHVASGSDVNIASAGSYAFAHGISHEGDCPTSTNNHQVQQATSQSQVEAAMNIYVNKEFDSRWCPNCLPEPKPGKKVRAWRRGAEIGCKNCGHVVDICTNAVVKQGKRFAELLKKSKSALDLIFDGLSENWNKIKQEAQINMHKKAQKEKLARQKKVG